MKKSIIVFLLLTSAAMTKAAMPAASKRPLADSVYVCQSKSAYAYHKYECRGLARCTHGVAKITRAQAIKMGYKPCKICY